MKKENAIWRFFASVKFALFTIFLLAGTSVIGTFIPQNNPASFYVRQYGPNLARLFQVLDVPNMYSSWWFTSLLALFSLNLIVCTIDRLPNVWRMVVLDNLATDVERLQKMSKRASLNAGGDIGAAAESVQSVLTQGGWKAKRTERAGGTLFFAQKGAWTRLGVYAVHLSILTIFSGAIIGSVFGFKASVLIPEGRAVSQIYEFGTSKPIALGFEVRCDKFSVSYYDNGTPREYRSELTVLDPPPKAVLTKSIVVNDPLTYKGLTFYQSSYEPTDEFVIQVENLNTKQQRLFRIPAARRVKWPNTDVSFGIINVVGPNQRGGPRFKIWFSDGKGKPSIFWVDDGLGVTIERQDANYAFSAKQTYATGLQVTKDPGVWVVYIGCILMLTGLYVAFFLSHKRIWVYIRQEGDGAKVLISGTSNKNTIGFARDFTALTEKFKQRETFTLEKEV